MTGRTRKLADGLLALAVFRGLQDDTVISALINLLLAENGDESLKADRWGKFVFEIYQCGGNLGEHIKDIVLESENPYVRIAASKKEIPDSMRQAFKNEINLLSEVAGLESLKLKKLLGFDERIELPGWETAKVGLEELYEDRLLHISALGYGLFAKYHVFTIDDGGLKPVVFHDKKKLSDLIGYERERGKVIENTEALLAGLPSNNVLLYGDAGTGKSSTVKAVANEYADKGLRLIEVKKKHFYRIPALIEQLSGNPLKFILFIDDLSFSANDDDFAALKAILEGSVNGGSENIAIYATSNRRHLVKETAAEREGDDLHLFDTIQETMSLSARFGLQVTFQRPDKELYLEIVLALAKQAGDLAEGGADEKSRLIREAEAYAISSGGRSPRTAKNFITGLLAKKSGSE